MKVQVTDLNGKPVEEAHVEFDDIDLGLTDKNGWTKEKQVPGEPNAS